MGWTTTVVRRTRRKIKMSLMLSRTALARRGLPVPMQQVRFHWYQDEIRAIRDPVTGKWRYEDPDFAVQRFDAGRTGTYSTTSTYEPWLRKCLLFLCVDLRSEYLTHLLLLLYTPPSIIIVHIPVFASCVAQPNHPGSMKNRG